MWTSRHISSLLTYTVIQLTVEIYPVLLDLLLYNDATALLMSPGAYPAAVGTGVNVSHQGWRLFTYLQYLQNKGRASISNWGCGKLQNCFPFIFRPFLSSHLCLVSFPSRSGWSPVDKRSLVHSEFNPLKGRGVNSLQFAIQI